MKIKTEAEKLRDKAMPDVIKLVKKHGRTPVYGCLLKLSKEGEVRLPKNFGKMKD